MYPLHEIVSNRENVAGSRIEHQESVLTPSLLLKITTLSGWSSPSLLESLSLSTLNLTSLGYYPSPTAKMRTGFIQMDRLVSLSLVKNKLRSLKGLSSSLLPNLESLSVSFNLLPIISPVLGTFPKLRYIDHKCNPVCSSSSYRSDLVSLCKAAKRIDGMTVTGRERRKVLSSAESDDDVDGNDCDGYGKYSEGGDKDGEQILLKNEEGILEDMLKSENDDLDGVYSEDGGEVDAGSRQEGAGEADVRHSLVLGKLSLDSLTKSISTEVKGTLRDSLIALSGNLESSIQSTASESVSSSTTQILARLEGAMVEKLEGTKRSLLEDSHENSKILLRTIEEMKQRCEDEVTSSSTACQTTGFFLDDEAEARERHRKEHEALILTSRNLNVACRTLQQTSAALTATNCILTDKVELLLKQLESERIDREEEIEVWRENFRRVVGECRRIVGDKGSQQFNSALEALK